MKKKPRRIRKKLSKKTKKQERKKAGIGRT